MGSSRSLSGVIINVLYFALATSVLAFVSMLLLTRLHP